MRLTRTTWLGHHSTTKRYLLHYRRDGMSQGAPTSETRGAGRCGGTVSPVATPCKPHPVTTDASTKIGSHTDAVNFVEEKSVAASTHRTDRDAYTEPPEAAPRMANPSEALHT